MSRYEITTRAEYDYAHQLNIEPLTNRYVTLEHGLRIEIQHELFGTGHTPEENEKFYRWCWEHKPHICEECMKPLPGYSAVFISHILTRGAHPDIAHDPRNVNILCERHHAIWENGRRETMRIYRSNQQIIEELKHEYYDDREGKRNI